jgi:hypothetical protein
MAEPFDPTQLVSPAEEFDPTQLVSPAEEFDPTQLVSPPEPKSDTPIFSDIAQGVGAGVIGVPQGIAETVAAGVDLAFDTDFSRDVTDAANAIKDYLGFTPETGAGKTAEALTTFGSVLIPFVGWASRASAVANGAKVLPATSRFKKSADAFAKTKPGEALFKGSTPFSRRARLAAGTTLGGGAIEMLVAPDGTHTLADAFEVLPTSLRTESDSGLQGRDEAGRKIRNKLRLFPEALGVGLAFEAAFPALSYTAKGVGRFPGIPATARLVTKGFDSLADKASTAFNGKVKKYFSSTGELDRETLESLKSTSDVSEGEINRATELLESFQQNAFKAVSGMKLLGRGKEGVQKAFDDLLLFMEGDVQALKNYKNPAVEQAAIKMRASVDNLTDTAIKEIEFAIEGGYGNKDVLQEALAAMETSKGTYLRRLFEGAFSLNTKELASLKNTAKYRDAVKQTARYVSGDDEAKKLIAAEAEVDRLLSGQVLDTGVDTAVALKHQQKAMTQGANSAKATPLYKMAEGMFRKRSKLIDKAPALRELMSEVRDPQKLFMTTISDLSRFNAASQLYRSVAATGKSYSEAVNVLNGGGRPFVISGQGIKKGSDEAKQLQSMGYEFIPTKKLVAEEGEELIEGAVREDSIFSNDYGALGGNYVAAELKNALTIPARNDNILNELLSLSLLAKGVSQMNVTVLNLAGQARNFGSGAFMVGANGNYARQMGLGETFDAVFKKAGATTDEEIVQFKTMINDLGLVDENLAVSEYKLLLQETQGLKSQKVGEAVNSLINKVPLVKPLQKLYSDTDTYWKTVGFVGEKAKFSSAFRNAGLDPENLGGIADDLVASGFIPRAAEITGKYGPLDVMAADIVKETMPIYSRTPMIVQKVIRKIPVFGSFTAFPAEVIRNTTNIVRRGTRELGFEAPQSLVEKIGPEKAAMLERQIRAIGANRLMSYVASAAVIPTAITKASYKATGVEEDQVDKMKEGMADWMKGSQLVSLGPVTKKGWEHFNLSYMMPYDFAVSPARAALEVYERNGRLGVGEVQNISDSLWTGFTKFMDPFASEALFAERLFDTLPPGYGGRGGKTVTGGDVYLESQDVGTRLARSFRHVADAFTPNVAQLFFDVRPEGVSQGSIARALTGDPNRRGKTNDIYSEMLALSGVRPQTYNPKESLVFAGFNATEMRSQSIRDFARVAQANNATKEDVLAAYERTNEDAFRHQKEMFGFVKNARDIGLNDAEILSALKLDSNLGDEELSFIMSGIFRPITISDDLIVDVFKETYIDKQTRKISQLPLAELFRKSSEFMGKKLTDPSLKESAEKTEPAFDPSQLVEPQAEFDPSQLVEPQASVAATTPPPVVAQAGAAPAPSVAPAPTINDPATLATVLPDRRDQVLAARLRGTA